jgi:hypothetical protein
MCLLVGRSNFVEFKLSSKVNEQFSVHLLGQSSQAILPGSWIPGCCLGDLESVAFGLLEWKEVQKLGAEILACCRIDITVAPLHEH